MKDNANSTGVPRSWLPRTTGAVLIAGLSVVLILWGCFGLNYATTRDIYFTFAMAHVLTEAPFLIRIL